MRTIALLLLLLPAQDPSDAEKACEAFFDRVASLDPAVRAKAREEFVKLATALRAELKPPSPAAVVALALLGDPAAQKLVPPLLEGPASPLTRAAAEAAPPDAAAPALLKLLEHEDLPLAMAAARTLSKSKDARKALEKLGDDSTKPRLRAIAQVALFAEGTSIAPLLSSAESKDPDAAWVALGTLPGVADDVRRRAREKEGEKEFRKLFEEQAVAGVARDLLGRVLVRAGIYRGPDLVDLALHKTPEVAEWGLKAVVDPTLIRKSVAIASVLKALGSHENKDDVAAPPIPALEGLLRGFGLAAEGEKMKERVANWRAAWDRVRITTIDRDVNPAIEDGVALLRKRQLPDGGWKFCACGAHDGNSHGNGTTALVAYTLIKCDVPVRDKAVVAALDRLLKDDLPNHVYTVSCQAMAFASAVEHLQPPPKTPKSKVPPDDLAALAKYLKRLRECAEYLVESQTRVNRGGYESGDWGYAKPANNDMDNSNAQFALLGLRSAANAGIPIPPAVWAKAQNHWQFDQNKDGSWPYRKDKNNPNGGGTRSMTAAGLYCSVVAKASLRRKDPVLLAGEDPFKKGLEYFKKSYPVYDLARDRSGGHVHSPYYDLYSLERAMMVTKTEKIGERGWYADGALFILANQGTDGEWIDTTDTCFALLFLKRAYVAVATGEK